jgi:hypothetical protein
LFCSALTEGIIWPSIRSVLGELVTPDSRLVIGFDPADLVGHPDRRTNAKDGHDSLVISDATYRRALGFGDEDSPDDDEYVRRVALRGVNVPLAPVAAGQEDSMLESIQDTALAQKGLGGAPAIPAAVPADTPDRATDGPSGVNPGPPGAVVAAARRKESLGELVGRLDRSMFDRLEAAASASMARALERSGARLRSKLSRNPDFKTVLSTTKNEALALAVGRQTMELNGISEEDLVDSDFAELEAVFVALALAAHKRVRTELQRRYGLDQVEAEAMEAKQREDVAAGAAALTAGMTAAALAAIYSPKPTAPSVGEFDPTSRVPPSLIRDTMQTAGGTTPATATPQPTGLTAGGETTRTFAGLVGLQQVGFVWNYGDELRQTFEPHFELDGEQFGGWEDAALTNNEDWPAEPFFFPGDHDGCRCNAVPIYQAVLVDDESEDVDDAEGA